MKVSTRTVARKDEPWPGRTPGTVQIPPVMTGVVPLRKTEPSAQLSKFVYVTHSTLQAKFGGIPLFADS